MESLSNSSVIVPHGWQRLVEKGRVFYISPDNRALRSREEVLNYLTSAGTCKCGLRCPFMLDDVFNFDPSIIGLPDNIPFTSNSLCSVKPHLTLHKVKRRPPTQKTQSKPKPFSSSKSIKKPPVLSPPFSLPPIPPRSTNKVSKPTDPKTTPISNLVGPSSRGPSPAGSVVHTNVSYPVLNLHALVSHITTATSTKSNTTTSTSISLPWLMNAIQKQRSVSPSSVPTPSSSSSPGASNSLSQILLVSSPTPKLSVPLVTSSPNSMPSLSKKKLLPKKPALSSVEGFSPPVSHTSTSTGNILSDDAGANSLQEMSSSQSLSSSLSSSLPIEMINESLKNCDSNSVEGMDLTGGDMSDREGPFTAEKDDVIDKNAGSDLEGGAYLQKVEKVANEFFRSQENMNNNSTSEEHEPVPFCSSLVMTHNPQEPTAPPTLSVENPNDLSESQFGILPLDEQNKLTEDSTSAVEERDNEEETVPPVSEGYSAQESFVRNDDELSSNINVRNEGQPLIDLQREEGKENEQENPELANEEPTNEQNELPPTRQEEDIGEGIKQPELTEQENITTDARSAEDKGTREEMEEEISQRQVMMNTDNEEKGQASSSNVCKGLVHTLGHDESKGQRERVKDEEEEGKKEDTEFMKKECNESVKECSLESEGHSGGIQTDRPEEESECIVSAKGELPYKEEEGTQSPVDKEDSIVMKGQEDPSSSAETTNNNNNEETTGSTNERDSQQCQPEQLMEDIDIVPIQLIENTSIEPLLGSAEEQNTHQNIGKATLEDGPSLDKGNITASGEDQDSIPHTLKETEAVIDDEAALDNKTRKQTQRKRKRTGAKTNPKPKPDEEDGLEPSSDQNEEKKPVTADTYDIEMDFITQDDENVSSSDQEDTYYPDKELTTFPRDYHLRGSATPPTDSPVEAKRAKKGRKFGRAGSSDGTTSRKRKPSGKPKSRSLPSSVSGNRASSSETVHSGEGKRIGRKRRGFEHDAIRWSTRRIHKRHCREVGEREAISGNGGSPDSVFSGIQSPTDIPLLGGPSSTHDKGGQAALHSVVARKRMRSFSPQSNSEESCLVEDSQSVSQHTKGNKEKLIVSISRKSLPMFTSYYTIRCRPFVIGDIVWARAPQLPYWPGKIISHKDWKQHKLKPAPKAQVWVKWFDTEESVSLVDHSNIRDISEGLSSVSKMKKERKRLKLENAIALAMKEYNKKNND
ncbi:PREDICTED: flocculation protein FLO11-like [Amphimedon queenslandica]|uniref:MBD domain-containing protein n=1 Tax=Amphimedon queenslandica TaxID=400682 RepID=A0A1X7UL82_AMPQE|nr:PREDICTED: flocculation protein FLO11-like [Amphimedon queenslandica]|eukprot:XP_011404721.2 PREDICTED: flocculation protein FLO11-like [Amphimedon queenslandica]